MMIFRLTRFTFDDGSDGVFAAFARNTELQLGDGDLTGPLRPQVLLEWCRAALGHLFGDGLAERHAEALAQSELVSLELRTPVDWEQEYLTLSRDELVGFVMGPQST